MSSACFQRIDGKLCCLLFTVQSQLCKHYHYHDQVFQNKTEEVGRELAYLHCPFLWNPIIAVFVDADTDRLKMLLRYKILFTYKYQRFSVIQVGYCVENNVIINK